MNKYRQKTCVICGVAIRIRFVLCSNCYSTHREYMHTPWFKELERMQRIQDFIDSMERDVIPDEIETVKSGVILVAKSIPDRYKYDRSKARGQPIKITNTIRERTKALRKEGLSYRKIGAILKISRDSVQKILSD